MDRGVRKAGAATDKDKKMVSVCDITEDLEGGGWIEKDYLHFLERKENGTNQEPPCLVVCPGWV